MDKWLGASLNTSDPVTHGIEACLCGVDLDNDLKLRFATSKLVLPVSTLWLALFHDSFFGILTVFEHLVDVLWLIDMWLVPMFLEAPSWCEPSCDSSAHWYLV